MSIFLLLIFDLDHFIFSCAIRQVDFITGLCHGKVFIDTMILVLRKAGQGKCQQANECDYSHDLKFGLYAIKICIYGLLTTTHKLL